MTVKRSYGIYQYPRIGFKIKNKPVRDWIFNELIQRGVYAKSYNRKDETYGLWLNGSNNCTSFLKTIGFLYPIKNKLLEKLIQEKQGRVSSNLAGVR
jgi:hypothetical protein